MSESKALSRRAFLRGGAKTAPRDIVMSVECGNEEEAQRSIKYLKSLVNSSAS